MRKKIGDPPCAHPTCLKEVRADSSWCYSHHKEIDKIAYRLSDKFAARWGRRPTEKEDVDIWIKAEKIYRRYLRMTRKPTEEEVWEATLEEAAQREWAPPEVGKVETVKTREKEIRRERKVPTSGTAAIPPEVPTKEFRQRPEAVGIGKGWIVGTVSDAMTNKRVENFTISVDGMENTFSERYKLEVSPSLYTVTCSKSGYEPQTKEDVFVKPKEIVRVDFSLEPVIKKETIQSAKGLFVSGKIKEAVKKLKEMDTFKEAKEEYLEKLLEKHYGFEKAIKLPTLIEIHRAHFQSAIRSLIMIIIGLVISILLFRDPVLFFAFLAWGFYYIIPGPEGWGTVREAMEETVRRYKQKIETAKTIEERKLLLEELKTEIEIEKIIGKKGTMARKVAMRSLGSKGLLKIATMALFVIAFIQSPLPLVRPLGVILAFVLYFMIGGYPAKEEEKSAVTVEVKK